MDANKGLKILGDILEWSHDEARSEFAWLRMMAAIKYDDYRDYLPGMRFLETLAAWLQQFDTLAERQEAYALLRERLVYISPPEMQRLVELFYPCTMARQLTKMIAQRRKIPPYRVHLDQDAHEEFKRLRRKTLILGLSDGARTDILRHGTIGTLTNEQFVIQTQVDSAKWRSLLDDLRQDLDDKKAVFEVAYLIDDFMGTGSSFLRFDKDKNKWNGKLCKFLASLQSAITDGVSVMASDWQLCVHHYLATENARDSCSAKELEAKKDANFSPLLTRPSEYTFGVLIPRDTCVSPDIATDQALIELTKKYYNTKLETRHTAMGGVKHLGLGYGECALPLVLHHNTPNNSLALIWAERPAGDKNGEHQREMRPLFRRRERHN